MRDCSGGTAKLEIHCNIGNILLNSCKLQTHFFHSFTSILFIMSKFVVQPFKPAPQVFIENVLVLTIIGGAGADPGFCVSGRGRNSAKGLGTAWGSIIPRGSRADPGRGTRVFNTVEAFLAVTLKHSKDANFRNPHLYYNWQKLTVANVNLILYLTSQFIVF